MARLMCALALALAVSHLQAAGILPQRGGDESSSGREGPSFVLLDLEGRKVSSLDLKDHYALVDFWATWCPPCRQSIPELIRLNAEYKTRGLKIVGINLDESKSAVPSFVKKFRISYPVLLGGDTDIMDRFGVRGLPSFYLLDPKGKVVKVWVGFGEGLPEEWRKILDRLL